jgi:heme-degrading monooxygenase HmoA
LDVNRRRAALMCQRGLGAFLFRLSQPAGFVPGNDYQQERIDMFIAMNRFQVKIGQEKAFETVWSTRESYLGNMAGFVEFHLLKGPVADDHTLYSSHTTWVDKAAFEAWTRSEEFRRAHARADNKTGESLYLGHPKFEGFEVIQSERKSSAAA